jgi:hypothetical protein
MQQCDCAGMHPPEGIQDLKAILLKKKWIVRVYEEGGDLYHLVKSARSSAGAKPESGRWSLTISAADNGYWERGRQGSP